MKQILANLAAGISLLAAIAAFCLGLSSFSGHPPSLVVDFANLLGAIVQSPLAPFYVVCIFLFVSFVLAGVSFGFVAWGRSHSQSRAGH